ncbi:MAG: hypothetical protein MJZ34_02725 [Paludibacteraceae bacterium]|nr:hypothetical protein [Paludibacteraceae bacterium]
MKNESEFCTIVKNSLSNGYKIPDPSSQFSSTTLRCFDGIGQLPENFVIPGGNPGVMRFVCWEAKHLKKMQSFSFKRVEEHQDKYLSIYGKSQGVVSLLIVGVDAGPRDKRAYVFDYMDCGIDLYKAAFSIHMKYLKQLPFNKITKKLFTFENIIHWSDIENVYNKSKAEILNE